MPKIPSIVLYETLHFRYQICNMSVKMSQLPNSGLIRSRHIPFFSRKMLRTRSYQSVVVHSATWLFH